MYAQRAHIMAPLTAMVGKNTKWEWDKRHEGAFQEMKRIMSQATLMTFPDFTKNFDIHTDASDYQMGGAVSQDGKPIAFFQENSTPLKQSTQQLNKNF